MSIWQLLPVGPTNSSASPYQSPSLHAGNPEWISIEDLVDSGWLADDLRHQNPWLPHAMAGFVARATAEDRDEFTAFKQRSEYWLEDYALFKALSSALEGEGWWAWPEDLRLRRPSALEAARHELHDAIEAIRFEQFLFFHQWAQLRALAAARSIALYGDLPIYPAHNSVDVWANQHLFLLDDHGQPTRVGGVPPDAFSATGQRWGNPAYDWERMRDEGFTWWLDRVRTALSLFDCLRIDHFRGFSACWHIAAAIPGAQVGEWHPVPGHELLSAIARAHPDMPFIAEDLGVITPDVDALREEFALPGIRVLQFAFDSDGTNPHLPHNHTVRSVSYTGTHDNNTALGWFNALDKEKKDALLEYPGQPAEPMPWPIIRMNLASVARIAIVPMQDVLALDESARMNTPGTPDGNWRWTFSWQDIEPALPQTLTHLAALYGRTP